MQDCVAAARRAACLLEDRSPQTTTQHSASKLAPHRVARAGHSCMNTRSTLQPRWTAFWLLRHRIATGLCKWLKGACNTLTAFRIAGPQRRASVLYIQQSLITRTRKVRIQGSVACSGVNRVCWKTHQLTGREVGIDQGQWGADRILRDSAADHSCHDAVYCGGSTENQC